MFTRSQYLNGECSHSEYYSQFVNNSVLGAVKSRFTTEQLQKAFEQDPHLNTIPLQQWDSLGYSIELFINFKQPGDIKTLAGLVCVAKQAAKQLIGK